MAITGKTGADAIYKCVRLICGTLKRYRAKFEAVVSSAQTAGAITSEQKTAILDFIAVADTLCVALKALAAYSGIS